MSSVTLQLTATAGETSTRSFDSAFEIGRADGCEVRIADPRVSRRHAAVRPTPGGWEIVDLDSRNGTWLNGERVTQALLPNTFEVRLGESGPRLVGTLDVDAEATVIASPSASFEVERRPASTAHGLPAVHEVDPQLSRARRTERRLRHWVAAVALLASVGIAAGGALFWQHVQQTRELALTIFYDVKQLEVQFLALEDELADRQDAAARSRLGAYRDRMTNLWDRYGDLLAETRVLDLNFRWTRTEKLIVDVVRRFGESELEIEADFVAEIKRHIEIWQTKRSRRLPYALSRLHERGWKPVIARELARNELPVHFMYVSLQESNFNERAVGPATRYGYAKGAWQFIPATAEQYGMRTGPLVDEPVFDPADERHDFERATAAAARFLRDLYKTEARASGLLVLAAYNWGPGNVDKRLETLPENPRSRTFWALLQAHRIPEETYDYVFSIVAAAVIGEDPAHFGFDFAPPLQGLRAEMVRFGR